MNKKSRYKCNMIPEEVKRGLQRFINSYTDGDQYANGISQHILVTISGRKWFGYALDRLQSSRRLPIHSHIKLLTEPIVYEETKQAYETFAERALELFYLYDRIHNFYENLQPEKFEEEGYSCDVEQIERDIVLLESTCYDWISKVIFD